MSDALERLSRLDAVRFDWRPDEARVRGFTHDLGFIAEDVVKVFVVDDRLDEEQRDVRGIQ